MIRLGLALTGLGAVLWGCESAPPPSGLPGPVRYLVVERPAGEVLPRGPRGAAGIDPGARLLTVEPVLGVGEPGPGGVEILDLSPLRAAPGEVVTARVRVARGATGERYRLIAEATRPDVEVIGSPVQEVQGLEPAVFRFTRPTSGRGGIRVWAEKIGP